MDGFFFFFLRKELFNACLYRFRACSIKLFKYYYFLKNRGEKKKGKERSDRKENKQGKEYCDRIIE